MSKYIKFWLIVLFATMFAVHTAQPDDIKAEAGQIPDTSEDVITSEEIIKPGDAISIVVKSNEDYNETIVVPRNGRIIYKSMGEIQAAGLTTSQLRDMITARLQLYVSDPQVEVSLVQKKATPKKGKEPEKAEVEPEKKIEEIKLEEDIQDTESEEDKEEEDKEEEIQEAELGKRKEEEEIVEIEVPPLPNRFGYDFFAGARNRIVKLEASFPGFTEMEPKPAEVRDAILGFVGPVDMMGANIIATVPSKYVLGPGDTLTLHFWSDVMEFQTVSLVVDSKGELEIPKIGRITVTGMTLAQFQEAARKMMERVAYKDLKLIATLDKLRSIQIFITGEAFRPGSYAVSVVTTLFNALYLCGGPSDNGSLRNIKLLRNNETKTVDFYKFLINGDSSQDFSLEAGDTILIPQVGRTANIFGEVRRPTEYELKEGENLLELISLAGGIRPSGFLQRVQIDSVHPGRERIVLDVDLSLDQSDVPIFDGDAVMVFSIPSERMNTVTLEGKVWMPGVYQLKADMKVSDLIQAARGLLGEAYMERADLFRLNTDKKTTKLIPINLSKALTHDSSNNISLRQWDRLVVYSKWDVKWIADRVVSVEGAVQRPGPYERSDDMTVGDLLIQAGGLLPGAYPDMAFLLRLNERGQMTESIPVNLKEGGHRNLPLQDGDTLLVYTYQEARWEPTREVTIEGAVQNPNVFPRTDGMKVSDLIQRSGGLLPDAYPDRALLLRLDEKQTIAQGFFISPKLALQDDPKSNLNLSDGDKLVVYTCQEAVWEPKREVTVAGAVQNPNVFERTDGMSVSDLIHRAGGVLPNAYLERADIKRFRPDHETYIIVPVNLARALSGSSDSATREADVLLQDEDLLTVYTLREAQYKPDNIATIYGAVQRPDAYTRTVGMKLSDLLFVAGGLLPGAHKEAEITRIGDDGKTLILTTDVIALTAGDDSQDILLEDEDVVSIRKQTEFLDVLRTVTVLGEVKYPGNYALKRNDRLSDLIERAGGLTDKAYPEASVITRKTEYLVLDEQKSSAQRVKKLFEDLNQMEYRREAAKAILVEERSGRSGVISDVSSSTKTPAIEAGDYIPTGEAVTEVIEASALSGIPLQTQVALSGIEEVTQPQQYTLVTPARVIDSFLPSGRVIVNLREAIDHPGVKDDIILEDGDRIVIPGMPATISVSGAVVQPSSLIYIKGKSVKDYIKMVGGYSKDADTDAVYIVKANGMVVGRDDAKLAPGDMIVVSTKVMVQKVTDRWGQVIGALKFTVTTLAMVITVKLILERI